MANGETKGTFRLIIRLYELFELDGKIFYELFELDGKIFTFGI